jgi:glutathione S-transferase
VTDGDISIFESGAILLHLGEQARADQMAHFAAAD